MRYLSALLFSLVFWTNSFAQNDSIVRYDTSQIQPLEITQGDLQDYLDDEAFDYEVVQAEDNWWDGVKNWFYNLIRRFFEWIFGVDSAAGYLSIFLKILPYILLAIFLYLVVRFFIKANTRSLVYNESNPNMVILSEEERILKTEDIQQLIKDALEAKNYRLAVRYYYLFILKLLSDRELIAWQLQKTNDDYMSELSGSHFKNDFNRATLLYDYIWYGEFDIDQNGYSKIEHVFASLKNSIIGNA